MGGDCPDTNITIDFSSSVGSNVPFNFDIADDIEKIDDIEFFHFWESTFHQQNDSISLDFYDCVEPDVPFDILGLDAFYGVQYVDCNYKCYEFPSADICSPSMIYN